MEKKKLFAAKYNPFSRDNIRYLKLFVSIYPGVAAVLLAFYKDPIVNSTRLARDYLLGHQNTGVSFSVNFWVLVYWLLLIFWIVCYYTFVTNEKEIIKDNNQEIKSAIFRSPNPRVYAEYEVFYKQIMVQLNSIDPNEPLKYENNIRNILSIICLLTTSYISRKDSDEIYGANIMIYIPLVLKRAVLEKIQKKEIEWIHLRKTHLDTFNGILYLVPELAYKSSSRPDDPFENGPSISLPVISELNDGYTDIYEKNIPGAPRCAVAASGVYLFSDVNEEKAYDHLGLQEKQNAEKYWKEVLPDIKSIVSFRIPHIWEENRSNQNICNLIAVLNIDSTKRDILGTDEQYHTTFYSLMYPILCQLAPFLAKYHQVYLTKLEQEL